MASTPAGSHGNDTAPNKANLDAPLSKNEPTSGPAGSSYETYEAQQAGQPAPKLPTPDGPPKQPAGQQNPPPTQHAPGTTDQRINQIVSSGFDARAASRPGRSAHDVMDTAKDLGSKAKHGLTTLSGGQIALGVGVVAAALAFFLTKSKRKYPKVRDQRGGRHKTHGHPTGHQPHTPRGNDPGPRSERPRGNPRFDTDGNYGRGRVQAGSGYDARRNPGARRDQGPSDRRYDARTGGRQNPNNVG